MEIVLVRHGESVADVERRHEGRADYPLTRRGQQQALVLAEWIASRFPVDTVLASPLERAAETARIVAGRMSLRVTYYNELMEKGNGVYAGLTFEEARRLYPFPKGGFKPHEAPPEGESFIEFRSRVESFWSRFCHTVKDEGQRVAIVTHGGVIHMLYRCFLRLPVDSRVRFPTGDTGVHLWRMTGDERVVLFANRLDHLESTSRISGDIRLEL